MVDKIETKWLKLEVKRHEYNLQEPEDALVRGAIALPSIRQMWRSVIHCWWK